jgi:hypothetical protein
MYIVFVGSNTCLQLLAKDICPFYACLQRCASVIVRIGVIPHWRKFLEGLVMSLLHIDLVSPGADGTGAVGCWMLQYADTRNTSHETKPNDKTTCAWALPTRAWAHVHCEVAGEVVTASGPPTGSIHTPAMTQQ